MVDIDTVEHVFAANSIYKVVNQEQGKLQNCEHGLVKRRRNTMRAYGPKRNDWCSVRGTICKDQWCIANKYRRGLGKGNTALHRRVRKSAKARARRENRVHV